MKKNVSEAKMRANRLNAEKSTGPQSQEGKTAVRHNALRHGLLSRDVVVTTAAGGESIEDYDRLLEGLRQYYSPEGAAEDLLVERIAVCNWRLRRALRFESISLQHDTVIGEELSREGSAHGSCYRDAVRDLQREVEETGAKGKAISDCGAMLARGESLQQVHAIHPCEMTFLFNWIVASEELDLSLSKCDGRDSTDKGQSDLESLDLLRKNGWSEASIRAACLRRSHQFRDVANEQIKRLERLIQIKDVRAGLPLLRGTLMSPEDCDRMTRYEVAIERQLYRASVELTRLQDRRRGNVQFNVGSCFGQTVQ